MVQLHTRDKNTDKYNNINSFIIFSYLHNTRFSTMSKIKSYLTFP